MNIAFEGVDKAGKTSLVNYFIRQRRQDLDEDWKLLKFSSPSLAKKLAAEWNGDVAIQPIMQAEMLTEYLTTFRIFSTLDVSGAACDRFFLGEFVYCLLRSYIYAPLNEMSWLHLFSEMSQQTKTILVYVKADEKIIIERMRAMGGDDFTPEDRVPIILNEYERVLKRLTIPYIVIDTTGKAVDEAYQELEEKIHEFKW